MAINVNSGFKVNAIEPIDFRLVLTKAEMKAIAADPDCNMPDIYFCQCSEDKKFYSFDYNEEYVEDDQIGGKWKPVNSDVIPISREEIDEIING